MDPTKGSLTSLLTSYARAYHVLHDKPIIFNDFLANELFTPEERSYFAKSLAEALSFFDPDQAISCQDQASALAHYMRIQGVSVPISRSRYTEDALTAAVNQGVKQYVILGAGFDTFAFRYPEMLKQIEVYEVDHPATQAFKLQRLNNLGWELPPQLHFVAVDFADEEDLATALKASTYDPDKPTFFSWLGVTIYLSREEVLATLATIAQVSPPGSTIIFDYLDDKAFNPKLSSQRMKRMLEIVQNVGEPIKSVFDPASLAQDLESLGLHLQEDLSPDAIQARYFQGRTDNYQAYEHFHFAQVVVK